MEITKSLEIRLSPDQIYEFWKDYENFQEILDNVESVRRVNATHAEWVLHGPMQTLIRFTSELTEDKPGSLLAWKSENGDLPHQGRVQFTPIEDGQKTQVDFTVQFQPPGGQLGEKIAKLGDVLESEYIGMTLFELKSHLEANQLVKPQ